MRAYNIYEVIDGNCVWIANFNLSKEQVKACETMCKQINGLRVLTVEYISALANELNSEMDYLKLCLLAITVKEEKKDVVIDLRSEDVIPSFRHYNNLKKRSVVKCLNDYPADEEII